MYISKVSIINYRNFQNAFFTFNKGINTIIGENGSGKTNLFRGMRLLLEDSSLQYAYKLSDNDFNRSIGDWRGHWIIISIEFDEISPDEAIQSLFIHGTGVIDKKDFVKKSTYNLFFRPKYDIRIKLAELKPGDKVGRDAILNTITIQDNYETYFTGKSIANFNDPDVYKELVGDFDEVKFSAIFDTSKFGIKIPHQLSVAKEISFTFIQALRDVVSDFHNNRTNPLITLLKNKSGEIKKEDFEPIKKMVDDLNIGIETLDDVKKIRDDIKETIKDAVGDTYSPSSLSIRSNLPNEAEKLLQSLKLYIGEPGETYEGGINELSLGGANLIFLTLKLLEYKYQKSKDTFANFLIIEEPEAHIHTHIQKTLFDNLDYGDTQIIYSTHSTHISEVSNVSNINILAKVQDKAEVYRPATGLKPENIAEIQRYLDAVRTTLLFAKGVILVEGDAEEILIPRLVKKAWGISLDELGISLINIRSTGFENVAQLFHDDRIKRKCGIVTDSDTAICDTTILKTDSSDEIAYKTHLKKSQEVGANRKTKLDTFTNANSWIKPFYSKYTFEIDFIEVGNTEKPVSLINEIYSDPPTRKLAERELKSTEVAVFGKRMLTMAKHKGKGWFAILLGEYVDFNTNIPKYILDAIMFAKGKFNVELIEDIVRFRIDRHFKSNNKLDFNQVFLAIEKYRKDSKNKSVLIDELSKVIPNDQIINFLKSV